MDREDSELWYAEVLHKVDGNGRRRSKEWWVAARAREIAQKKECDGEREDAGGGSGPKMPSACA